jgi:hypothetical protein
MTEAFRATIPTRASVDEECECTVCCLPKPDLDVPEDVCADPDACFFSFLNALGSIFRCFLYCLLFWFHLP